MERYECKDGWLVIQEYESNDLVSNSEDEKRKKWKWKKDAAEKKRNDSVRPKPGCSKRFKSLEVLIRISFSVFCFVISHAEWLECLSNQP